MFSYFFDFQCGVFVLLTNVMRAKVKKYCRLKQLVARKCALYLHIHFPDNTLSAINIIKINAFQSKVYLPWSPVISDYFNTIFCPI